MSSSGKETRSQQLCETADEENKYDVTFKFQGMEHTGGDDQNVDASQDDSTENTQQDDIEYQENKEVTNEEVKNFQELALKHVVKRVTNSPLIKSNVKIRGPKQRYIKCVKKIKNERYKSR